MSKIWRVEEEQIMKAGKIVGTNYTVWYKDEDGSRTARRDYRHGHYKVIPMTVLNFILDENNEARTRYQEFDGNTYKRTMYQQPTETENAPQAATQAADNDSTTDNTTAIMKAIENAHRSRYSARQTAPLTFAIWDNVKNIPIIETTSNGITAYMDIFGIDHIDADTAEPTDTDTEEKKEAETMTTTEREALERINARQNAANHFTNIGPADIAAELAAMEAEQAAPAPDPDAATLAPADAAQVWDEDGNTITTEETTTNEQKEEEKPMSNPNKLYLSNWDYNAALIIEELAEIVKNNGGTVKPGTETIIENRALNENLRKAADRMTQLESIEAEAPGTNEHRTDAIKRLRADIEKWERIDNTPRTVHHCTWSSAYISFKLGGMYYYYQTDSNPFFDFYYQKTPIDINGTVSRCACLESDKKEWLYDCFFRAEATDADRREAANLIYNMLVKAAPSVIRRDSHRVRVRNQYDGRYHYETVYEKERREAVNF